MPMKRPDRLRDRAAQLLMIRFGSNVPPPIAAEDDVERVRTLLSRYPVGGVILFRGHAPEIRDALREVQAALEIPLLVGSDLERGAGQQVQGGTRFPHAMALGHAPDPEDAAARLARATALEAHAIGIHLAFAPVTDIHLTAENPIIGPRAFGSDPDLVARCAEAYVREAHRNGLLTCAKHFPGHGRTVTDSHETRPVVDTLRPDLDATDLVPFRSAIAAGVDTVMTAHVAYPSLDPTGTPATASAPILKTLLREEMAFEGCVVSDSLLMDGIAGGETPGEQAAAIVAAGVDLLLDPQEPEAVVDGLVAAVKNGSLSEARLNEAFERVWTLKQRAFSLARNPSLSRKDDPRKDKDGEDQDGKDHHEKDRVDVRALPAFEREAVRLARSGITVRGGMTGRGGMTAPGGMTAQGDASDATRTRPSAEEGPPAGVVCVRLSRRESEGDALLPGWDENLEWLVHAETSRETIRRIWKQAKEAEAIVCVVASVPAAWQSFGLPEALEAVAADLLRAGAPSVLAVLGSPHAGDRVEAKRSASAPGEESERGIRIDLYSDEPVSRRVLWDTLRDMLI
jgi:beta-glucosidase-like glycosyl hydrolase